MSVVENLEPRPLWRHFDEILKIPRGSKNEGKMRDYVIAVAERNGLEHKVDATGNVMVKKDGTPGHERAPITVLQSHLDMVEEKNADVDHDFEKDPIQPEIDDGYLTAKGTTLGSDNGIGVAAMLALMESKEVSHGPLELLFTVDEETGLTGASALGEDMLEGRQLLNLDSEDEGVLTVGCAGGADSELNLPLEHEKTPSGAAAVAVKLVGLKGGHSGVDIHLQRGNAIKLLVRALHAGLLEVPFQVASLQGGNKHNAIPREAFATTVVAKNKAEALRKRLEEELAVLQAEYRPAEPNMSFEVGAAEAPDRVWTADTTAKALNLINALPHGVLAMSYDIPGLVETSTNLATVAEKDGGLSLLLSSRSSVATALEALRRRIRSTAELAGTKVKEGGGYPGWKPDMSSHLLEVVKKMHQEVLGSEPEVSAVHAGLECGIIGEKYDGMDMISFGPQIEFPHSPDERVKIDSVNDFWKLLTTTLEALA